jgi:tetratricopeptide (TPR) repeat protein
MNHHLKFFLALWAGSIMLLPLQVRAQAQSKPAQNKAAAAQPQEPAEEYTDEEYDAYEKATKEPDLDKRGTMLIEFMDKYPQSKLQPYIVNSYQTLIHELYQAQKWDQLEPTAERWLKYRPGELQTFAYIAESSQRLGHDQKYIDYALKIFAQKPDPQMAAALTQSYKKIGDEAKYLEWTQKLWTYPDFEGDFNARFMFAQKYAEQKKYDKAAEYSQLTLKSLDVAKKPDAIADTKWQKETNAVRRACNYFIGLNYYEKKQWEPAIIAFQKAIKVEKFDAAYYYIGLAQWKQERVEEAMLSFARAEMLKGEMKSQAKDQLEKLYKGIHNDTLIGIDKIYKRATEEK